MRLLFSILIGALVCICGIQSTKIMTELDNKVTVYTEDNIYYFYPAQNKVQREDGFELKFKDNKEMNEYSERLTTE